MFEAAILNKADFAGAQLAGASFVDAQLEGAWFYRAQLQHASLGQGAQLQYAWLEEA